MFIIVVSREQINPTILTIIMIIVVIVIMITIMITIMVIVIITIIIRWRIEIPVPLMAATCGVPAQESLNNW